MGNFTLISSSNRYQSILWKKVVFAGIICCFNSSATFAQTADVSDGQEYVYKQTVAPQGVDNYLFSTYYYNDRKTYNLRGVPFSSSKGAVTSMKINPSGTSVATLSEKNLKSQVAVYDLWKSNKKLHKFGKVENPLAICYTSDAQKLLISTSDKVLFFDAREYEQLDEMPLSFGATKMIVSSNNYYLAATDGKKLAVWNLENKSVRKELDFGVAINDFAFSNNCEFFAVLTADGLLSLYSTSNFLIQQSFPGMGDAIKCAFHPEGKYMSVVTGDNRIAIVNIKDEQDRNYIDDAQGGIKDARFVRDGKKTTYLTYNTTESMVYKSVDYLLPHYTQLLADELDNRMNDWAKMLPGESLEEYNVRVNDDTRANQMRLYEQEIATRMAGGTLQMADVSLGSYNPVKNMLSVNIKNMPSIYLNVPENEVNDFAKVENLEFRNAKYGLTKNDKFELVYADVYNKNTGKTYVYDNRERQSMDVMGTDNLVPLNLIQQSSLSEVKLNQIKENVINSAKANKTISNHTNILVNTKVVPSKNADGKGIMNLQVDFAYDVDNSFSAQEDFAPGKYKIKDSGAASAMLSVVKTALETEFAQYVKDGKKVQVMITGMADALPINGKINYDGSLGNFVNEPVYKNGDLSNITVTKAGGITQNEQLAFLRGVAVKKYLTSNVPALDKMKADYRQNIKLESGKGGKFRRITVEFTFVGAY